MILDIWVRIDTLVETIVPVSVAGREVCLRYSRVLHQATHFGYEVPQYLLEKALLVLDCVSNGFSWIQLNTFYLERFEITNNNTCNVLTSSSINFLAESTGVWYCKGSTVLQYRLALWL